MKSKAVICTLLLGKLGAGKSDLPSLLGGKQRHPPVNTTFNCFPKGWYSLGLALLCLTHLLPPSFSPGPCALPQSDRKAMNSDRRAHGTYKKNRFFHRPVTQVCYYSPRCIPPLLNTISYAPVTKR